MRILLQRVSHANVAVDEKTIGAINHGFLALVGFAASDNQTIFQKMIQKMINLRIFEDENGKMNLSLLDKGGSVLWVSQFTLYADCRQGRRPGFSHAAPAELGRTLYEDSIAYLTQEKIPFATGEFGAHMKVNLENDGPVTILLDSDEIL